MENHLKTLALGTTLIAACNIAVAGTVNVAKQIHSQQGLDGVTATQSSNTITYTLAEDYTIDDTITFTFSEDLLSNFSFPDAISAGTASLALDSSTNNSATYKTTSTITTGETITFGSTWYSATLIIDTPLTVTVSSQTASADPFDTAGTRTATIAEAKSQFGDIAFSSTFDAVIQNDNGQNSTSFVSNTPVIQWFIINPSTTGWLNLASTTNTQITLEGEEGSMTGLTVASFNSNGTHTFSADDARLSISASSTFPTEDFPGQIAFTPPGDVVLVDQSFKMSLSYGYWSAAAVQDSAVVALKINAGQWTLSTPATDTESAVQLSGSVSFDYKSNTLNGAFCDLDDVLDPGETSMLTVTLTNAGSGLVSGVSAQVSSDADISFADNGVIEFADMPSARDTASTALEVTLNSAEANESIDIVITFMSDDLNTTVPEPITTTLNVNSDYIKDRTTEDFETSDTIWLDWQRSQQTILKEDPEHFLLQWEVYEDDNFGAVMFGPNLSQQNDISLMSPTLTVEDSGDFSLNFDHYFEFETGTDLSPWDGGVIEISVNGGDWTDVVEAGGVFAVGYNGTIATSNPSLSGREGFVSQSVGSSLTAESLSFSEGDLNGSQVQFRFRIGSDGSVSARGWNIDNVSFTNMTEATPFSVLVVDSGECVNRTPFLLNVTATDDTLETNPVTLTAQSFDHDAGDISYIWTQIAGSSPINTWDIDATSTTLTFNAPTVTDNETYTFSVVANDGELSSSEQQVSVTVINNVAPVITTNQSSITIEERESVTLTVLGSDTDNDSLTYEWTMDGEILDTTGVSYIYTAPSITNDLAVAFSVTATDGSNTSEAIQINVNITNSSGGGSMGAWTLLLLSLAFIRRKNKY